MTWGWRKEPARHALAARGIVTSGSEAATSTVSSNVTYTARPIKELPATPWGWERRTARRFGRKGSSEEELFPILRKLAGYQDDGTKSYQQVPEGLSEELLEQRLGILLKEAELGRREGGNKQFLKDAKKFERSRSKSQ